MSAGSAAWISLASTFARSGKFVAWTVFQICVPASASWVGVTAVIAGVRSAPRYRFRVMTLTGLALGEAACAAGASIDRASTTLARRTPTTGRRVADDMLRSPCSDETDPAAAARIHGLFRPFQSV